LEYIIRAPASYPKTRIYQESLAEELVFVLGEFHALMGRHIAFPEMTIPVIAALKRHLKRGGGSSKSNSHIKTLVEKIEATRTWVEKRRQNVDFAPNNRTEVESFLEGTPVEATPIGTWMRLQRKVRDQKRKEIEMVRIAVVESCDRGAYTHPLTLFARPNVKSEVLMTMMPRVMTTMRWTRMRRWMETASRVDYAILCVYECGGSCHLFASDFRGAARPCFFLALSDSGLGTAEHAT
jgi:hypothetical protein